MKTFNRPSACVIAAVAVLLSACGGGGSDAPANTDTGIGGGVKPTTPTTPTLSANQAAFEEFLLNPAGGSYQFRWSTVLSGSTVTLRSLSADFATLTASPLTAGPQISVQSPTINVSQTLPTIEPLPTRILKDGAILVVPGTGGANRVTYVGNDVRVDTLAEDKSTVAYSFLRTDFQNVSLSGPLTSAPTDLLRFHDQLLAHPVAVDPSATFLPGSKYSKFTRTNLGDRYIVADCGPTTKTALVTSCAVGTTLTVALTNGLSVSGDATVYRLAGGTVRTVGGVNIWVASAPRPKTSMLTYHDEYRTFFELNGNVYAGSLVKDGAVMGSSVYLSNPNGASLPERFTPLPYDLRLNKAAYDSFVSALKI